MIESRKRGGMGTAEAVPFGNRDAADAFAAANGGRVVTFAQIPSAYVLGSDAPGEQTPTRSSGPAAQLRRIGRCSTHNLTRRRMIAIVAAQPDRRFSTGGRLRPAGDPVRWHGSALGAQVSIEIYHPDRAEAERIGRPLCPADVRRLEQQFSLYRADSAICTLNRTGILVSPDPDMVTLLKAVAAVCRADRWGIRSDGATVMAALCRSFQFR